MKRKLICSLLILFVAMGTHAQQYALFNTKTLFDTFENPAQKAFTLDSSRQYASNFLLPYLDLSGLNKGNSDEALRKLINTGYSHTRSGPLDKTTRESINIYLLSFRMFKYHKYHSEMGFSWQIRSETEINYSENESLGFFDTFKRFSSIPRINVFNNNNKLQTYHQISFNYRENYNKRWAFGTKLSLLSGIGYSEFHADQSSVSIDPANNKMNIQLAGNFKLNYPEDNKISFSKLLPFKNLGLSITLGTTHTTKSGILLMANVKDLGFIRWGKKKSFSGSFDISREISDITGPDAENKMYKAMNKIAEDSGEQKAFYTPINTRADFLISKTFGPYTPSLILTKNVFNKFGEAAFVNTIKSGLLSFSAVPSYNLDQTFRLGIQGMIQTPNFEMFLGTNDVIQSYYASKEIIKNNEAQATGYNRGSVYMGIAFKIGYIVEHPQNMSWMPGVGKYKDRKSFFGSLFGIFKKKNN
ncbi:DUF5723 family protein [Pedobacter sp. ASV28]|uniref:DUF5723 family protein n=1 Tax=Pedobacter sp. ASV28 TaxID=2795123 RepID=UPI0018EB4933|nr:DUF5723 family protein [Pedobacter sp. ASV28]